MKNTAGEIIYIGKASRLRSRVRSYFGSARALEPRVQILSKQIADIEHIITETATEALHLEATLVKRHQPHHNVRLKDDKHYPYLKVDIQNEWPQVTITRRIDSDGAKYFGPYASPGSVRRSLAVVNKLFPWRSCTKKITGTDDRPCLDYFIDRCIAPCTSYCTKDEYDEVIQSTILFLDGKSKEVESRLIDEMKNASENLEYEKAARIRDQLEAIEKLHENQQQMVTTTPLDADVFGVFRENNETCIQVFFARGTMIVDTDSFMLMGTENATNSEILTAFLGQFYENANYIPKNILLPYTPDDIEELESMLRTHKKTQVNIIIPKRGHRRSLVTTAEKNARESMAMHHARWVSDTQKTEDAIKLLQVSLDLPEEPQRIECYDISTIQGTNTVGSMVVFNKGKPVKSEYRRFKIKSVDGQNDFASMQELLKRRFTKIADNLEKKLTLNVQSDDGDSWVKLPDLVIIDGGKGQLSVVLDVMRDLGLSDIPVCGLAKKKEELFIKDQSEPIELPASSQAMYLIQRIRDEAHRFAINYHRSLRNNNLKKSLLDSIQGIGPKRKKALYKKFGSMKAMREATIEDLAATEGFSINLAKNIKTYL